MAPYAVSQCPHWVYYWPRLLQLYFTVVWLYTTPAYWCLYYKRLFILRTHNLWYYQHWAILWLWPQTVYSISHRTSECLKSLYWVRGIHSMVRGLYIVVTTPPISLTRFSLRQRIAFLVGQVQCLKIHLSLEGNRPRTNTNTVPGECNTLTD